MPVLIQRTDADDAATSIVSISICNWGKTTTTFSKKEMLLTHTYVIVIDSDALEILK